MRLSFHSLEFRDANTAVLRPRDNPREDGPSRRYVRHRTDVADFLEQGAFEIALAG
jgi:hypothetical protein